MKVKHVKPNHTNEVHRDMFTAHHQKKQEEQAEKERKQQEELLQQQQAQLQQQQMPPARFSPGASGAMYRGRSPRFNSPRGRGGAGTMGFPAAGSGVRHEPYNVRNRPGRPGMTNSSATATASSMSGNNVQVKAEPDDASNLSTGDARSISNAQNDDENSEQGQGNDSSQEGLGLGAEYSNFMSGDSSHVKQEDGTQNTGDVNVKLEQLTESDLELEITGVEPGTLQQEWDPSGAGTYDPNTSMAGLQMDASGSQAGYSK